MSRFFSRVAVSACVVVGALVGLPLAAQAAPSNDLPTAPTVMTSANPTQATGGNYRATDTDDPAGFGAHKVWFSWTAPASGTVDVDTYGSSFDTWLAVWSTDLTHLADNDDVDASFRSLTSFTATSGTTYLFSVGGSSSANSGSVRLAVWFGDSMFTSGPHAVSVTPVSLPPSPTPPACGGFTMGTSYRWFSWISDGTTANFDTFGSSIDTVLFAYASNKDGALSCIASNDDATASTLQSQIQVTQHGQERLYVLVGAFASAQTASITFNYSGVSASFPTFDTAPNVPSAPQSLAASSGNSGIHLAWSAPSSNGGSLVHEYVVYRGSGGNAPTEIGSTTGTTFDDDPGAGTWTYQVTAVNDRGESPAASVNPPDAPTGASATRGDQAVDVSWTASTEHGAAVTGYTASASPGGHECTTTGATGCTVTGLTNGTSYTFQVSATSVLGDSAASTASNAVTPAGHPGAPTGVTAAGGDGAATVSWSPSTPNGDAVTGYTVTSSPGGLMCSTAGELQCTVSGLTNNTVYTFTVVATNGVGDSAPSAASNEVAPGDTVDPTVTAGALSATTLATKISLSFSGTDNVKISDYDVRYRKAPYNGGFGSYVYPSEWQHTTATKVSLSVSKGTTYCLSVRSRDVSDRTSGWSERCTAVALDDRSLSITSGWTRGTGTAYYAHTITRTTKKGVALTRTGVQAKRIYLVVTRCRGCATVGIYWNGTLLKKVSLASSTTKNKQVIAIKTFSAVKTGKLTIKTLTTGGARLDGAVFSRA